MILHWHKKQAFEYIFTYSKEVLGILNSNLLFPTEWDEKSAVVEELNREGLLKYCWTCEWPTQNSMACGNCVPCKHMASACRDANIENPFVVEVKSNLIPAFDNEISDCVKIDITDNKQLEFDFMKNGVKPTIDISDCAIASDSTKSIKSSN